MNYKKFFLKKNSFKKKGKDDEKTIYEPSPEYKEIIINQAYLGKKGYTIPKKILEKEDEKFLRKDLFVKPEVNGINYGAVTEDSYFPVFRENDNKIYLPRFYGIERYGHPIENEIQDGDNISLEFDKPLRDYQENIIKVYIDHVKSDCINGGGGILDVYTGSGKTVMALKILSILSKKTLIIVHKEFLMNQWIERIEEFLPTAKI
jgi:SNF2 family DNA or RNA helicase